LETSKGCATTKEIKASQAGGVRHDSVASVETRRCSPPMVFTRELVEVRLTGVLRQLHVNSVENVSHGHGVAVSPGGVEAATGNAWDLKNEARRVRRDRWPVHRVRVAGRMEVRRGRGLYSVEVQLGRPVARIGQ
jgi:hypothetical protein